MPQSLPVTVPVADSVSHYTAQYPDGFTPLAADSVSSPMPRQECVVTPAEPTEGYKNSPLHDTGAMTLLLISLFFVIVNYRSGYKCFQNFFHDMFSIRRRENLFEDHTFSETRVMTALIFNTCVMEGMMMFFGFSHWMPSLQPLLQSSVFTFVALFSAVALAFYLLQMALYLLLGYVFSDSVNTKLWIDGFKSSQALLGLLLVPVVMIILVYPSTTNTLLITAVFLYFSSRIVFICKGFRIFFNNLTSSVYFILYLCSVEIVPPVLTIVGAIKLCEVFTT